MNVPPVYTSLETKGSLDAKSGRTKNDLGAIRINNRAEIFTYTGRRHGSRTPVWKLKFLLLAGSPAYRIHRLACNGSKLSRSLASFVLESC